MSHALGLLLKDLTVFQKGSYISIDIWLHIKPGYLLIPDGSHGPYRHRWCMEAEGHLSVHSLIAGTRHLHV